MKPSKRQQNALEKITGKPWDSWHREAVGAYFAYTENGQTVEVSGKAGDDLQRLLELHRCHSMTIEMWREDFKSGLLTMRDFVGPQYDYATGGYFEYPRAYIQHAYDVHREAMVEVWGEDVVQRYGKSLEDFQAIFGI